MQHMFAKNITRKKIGESWLFFVCFIALHCAVWEGKGQIEFGAVKETTKHFCSKQNINCKNDKVLKKCWSFQLSINEAFKKFFTLSWLKKKFWVLSKEEFQFSSKIKTRLLKNFCLQIFALYLKELIREMIEVDRRIEKFWERKHFRTSKPFLLAWHIELQSDHRCTLEESRGGDGGSRQDPSIKTLLTKMRLPKPIWPLPPQKAQTMV